MQVTTVSPKFQVVIPRKIREQFEVKPGQKVVFLSYEHSLRLVFVPSIEEARGILKDMDTYLEREEDDRV